MKKSPSRIGDLVRWTEDGFTEKAGILLEIMEDRGHYSVIKILMQGGDIMMIKYIREFPETISEYLTPAGLPLKDS